ncbi:tRNA synthetases class II (A)-domain-containing protein [Coemansia spiralis]|nr:tRNA synthetases class II (A)-domain-containing protein [Coemansia spiralis]
MSASEIRKRYLDYFVKHGHTRLPSADIVPKNDSTLLFTNAGMVPLKQYFLSPALAPHKMITAVQKSSGLHTRHHTFFEMLGNFSFGAYDKRATIHMAWRFIAEELKLPKSMLRVTVLETDDEAYDIWLNEIGFDEKRIVRLGPDDNFWSMGHGEGPCGPCSEVFWDTQDPRYSEDDEERWLEFWNLVFMQYYRTNDGELKPLDIPCIDTGMGLERVASILQQKRNNFDTDEFQTIIQSIQAPNAGALDSESQLTYKRILADHLRASAFLIAEGVYPSNTGRGYVLRRIIRRAVRAGRLLGINASVLSGLYPSLEAAMGSAYPELIERRDPIISVIKAEENAFLKTLDKGMALLEDIFANGDHESKTVSGSDAFTLYDTHGFPVDLTQIIARDNGWSVDVDEVDRLLTESRERNRSSWKSSATSKSVAGEINAVCTEWQDNPNARSRFCGHDINPEAAESKVASRVVAFKKLSNGDGLIAIDPCPFYATSGGQEADTGTITVDAPESHGVVSSCHKFAVKDAIAMPNKTFALHIEADADMQDALRSGPEITASVDMGRRYSNAVHHTATHLLNAALRKVVGSTVIQAGSLVQPTGLRFDFTSQPLSQAQLKRVEHEVNKVALENLPVAVSHMSLDQAKAKGAVAMFTEKYDVESVRVVQVPGVSMELCGGTHLHSTRAVFPFQIVSEGSIAAGTRRIEAVAGMAASAWLQKQLGFAQAAAYALETPSLAKLETKARQLVDKSRALREEADRWLLVAATSMEDIATHATVLGNVPTCIHILGATEALGGNARVVAERASYLRKIGPLSAHAVIMDKHIALAIDTIHIPNAHAGTLLRELLTKLLGKGGGQQVLAQGQLETAITSLGQLETKLG